MDTSCCNISRARRALLGLAALGSCLATLGCATVPADDADSAWWAQLERWQGTPLILLGEQHDAPEHQAWERASVQRLAARKQLRALVIEMAEAGRSTEGLASGASEHQVREALHWSDGGWPWAHYGPVVMAAVRAGVPVAGGNLPHARMRAAMADDTLDTHLDAQALARQQQAVRSGHCNLLPETQIAPMTRVQLARDASLAATARAVLGPGASVLLVAGSGHVWRSLAVPTWLPANLDVKVAVAHAGKALIAIEFDADYVHHTRPIAERDHCTELRQRLNTSLH